MVRRIYVEKKTDPSKEKLIEDLKKMLAIDCHSMRKILRYDVEGIDEELMRRAAVTVFSEPPLDNYFFALDFDSKQKVIIIEYLEGQFDQRADSASQCIQLLSGGTRPKVKCATLYVFDNINENQYQKIKHYLINPVETKSGNIEIPKTLEMEVLPPTDAKVEVKGFLELEDLDTFHKRFGLACTVEDLQFIQFYFRNEKRNPTLTEIKAIDTYWSDHCRHTTFLTQINNIKIVSNNPHIKKSLDSYRMMFNDLYKNRQDKYPCLMDIATIVAKDLKKRGYLDNLDESDEINACSVVVDVDVSNKNQKWLIMFKNETHNHPTEIEPFGGAATCLGGAIRDPLSGRTYVYQAMRVTGSGNPLESYENTLKGKLPQRMITTTAAHGFSSYGNQIGLATGIVAEVYNDRYKAKRLETGYVIGGAPMENVVRKKPKPGDVILLVGGDTGRDGCGGATGSSKSHTKMSVESCGAEVQKGNPPEERKIQRLFRNKQAAELIIKCNDFGAGGVSVAIGELADGVDIYLDRINKKYEGLTATELAISESQERMAVVVESQNVESFIKFAERENLSASVVGVVTNFNRLRMFYADTAIVDLSRNFLNSNGVKQMVNAEINDSYNGYFTQIDSETKALVNNKAYRAAIENELKKLNVCSKKGLGEMFDSTIGAASVLMPFGGKTQLTPSAVMASKPPVVGFTHTVTCSSYALYPDLMIHSPYIGAVHAILGATSKLVSCGVKMNTIRLSLQEYFKKLGKDEARWGEPLSALLGAFEAEKSLDLAAIGGKDSMSGSFENLDVPPTVIAFAFGTTTDKTIIHNVFPSRGIISHIEIPRDEYGMPDLVTAKSIFENISSLIESKKIIAAAVVEDGGRIAALVKSLIGDNNGAVINELSEKDFYPYYGDLLVISNEKIENIKPMGILNDSGQLFISGDAIPVSELAKTFTSTLESVFPSTAPATGTVTNLEHRAPAVPKKKTADSVVKPRVFIPVFPGTNCEYDTAKAFTKAGASVNTFVIKNRTGQEIEDSIKEMQKLIDNSQIIAFPGGFSGGDEPDGSGKFIAVTFQNQRLREAIENLLHKRDGLIIGICNGFQALIKLGLLPGGIIKGQNSDSPTLTFNNIGRHVSTICNIRVASNNSPWLSGIDVGSVYSVPVSHGEGKFVCDKELLDKLTANGQIATQYIDLNGKATMQSPFNPNGSIYAVEGLLSPDGRIFGKMGHAERWQQGLYQNVGGNYYMPVFESGVRYFK